MTTKENSLTSNAKDSMKLGIGSMAGMSALGAMQKYTWYACRSK